MLEELRAPPPRGPLVFELERLRDTYRGLGLTVDLVLDDAVAVVDDAHAAVFVDSAKEALTNAVRHGRASEATVAVRVAADSVALDVFDNGGGSVDDVREGFGLQGMRERAAACGGDVVVAGYDEGLRLTVTLPRGVR